MKINWGTGLVIGMAAFISFIMYFVVTMMTGKDYEHDLVVEDYYKAELHYQQDIDAKNNALALNKEIRLSERNGKLVLHFPESIHIDEEARATFYRPSNKALDFSISLSELTNGEIIIPEEKLVAGRWNMSVNWSHKGKDFLIKKEIVY